MQKRMTVKEGFFGGANKLYSMRVPRRWIRLPGVYGFALSPRTRSSPTVHESDPAFGRLRFATASYQSATNPRRRGSSPSHYDHNSKATWLSRRNRNIENG
ncbi:hypothetical protein PIIN_08431 [Serendipita indica DSM 11827]|uniref:Uncharacterized protein n=1 Tax=Serendipita indica (strain DSM 11827) TaxID=1109443 RepID=G4TT35_SERID|nr:hypothetical protein PIIN_08431 [Serendipita indica DSM 11827]